MNKKIPTTHGINHRKIIRIAITGRCNLTCQYCPIINNKQDMPLEQVIKIINFGRQLDTIPNLVLSGGEPLMHCKFAEILQHIHEFGYESLTLKTNGTMLSKAHLALIKNLSFSKFLLSVNIDNLNAVINDDLHACFGSFAMSLNALRLAVDSDIDNMQVEMRSNIQPTQIDIMEKMALFAENNGCQQINFSIIHPIGRAAKYTDLLMDTEQKFSFLKEIERLKQKLTITIITNKSHQCLVCDSHPNNKVKMARYCNTHPTTIYVNANGDVRFCQDLQTAAIMNIFPLTTEEIINKYNEMLI